ncbi:hypothetical protein ABE67_12025 [Cytobacillus firmus]|nr:hypothetical protein [Cytobacillus firmus]
MNRLKTATFFITSFLMFFLGLHGISFFGWLYAIILAVNVTQFGTFCTWLSAIIVVFIQWKSTMP